VGSSSPGRWAENAAFADKGPLPSEVLEAVRARWSAVARDSWTGQQ
jgi:hypothetical protein